MAENTGYRYHEVPLIDNQEANSDTTENTNKIIVVLAGKSGAGKTTLMNTLFGTGIHVAISPDSTTKVISSSSDCISRNGVDIHIIDTPGLEEKEKVKKAQMKKLAKYTKGKADLLVYCIPVNPTSKFADFNPATCNACKVFMVRKYGSTYCIPIFTLSNQAWDSVKFRHNDHTLATEEYKKYIKTYAERFETVLKDKLKLRDQRVTTIFDPIVPEDKKTMVAIPAGFRPNDPVLPGIEVDEENWKGAIIKEMLRRGDEKCKTALLKYKYGIKAFIMGIKGTAIGGVVGGAMGAVAGAGIGAGVGLIGGPIGVAVGGAVGGVVGGILVGGAIGGVGGAGKTLKERRDVKREIKVEEERKYLEREKTVTKESS